MQSYLSSRFFLFFPLPLIAFQIATMFLAPGTLNFTAIDFIGETFFLGSAHGFRSIGILLLPAAAGWLNQRTEANRQSIGSWTIALSILLFSFFMWRALSGVRPNSIRPTVMVISDLIFTALLLHHTLWQVKGLSMTYRFQQPLGSATSSKLAENVKWRLFESDHTPFYLLLSLALLRPSASAAKALFPSLDGFLNLRAIGLVASLCMFAITAMIVIPDLIRKESHIRNRGWFNLRLTSWALIPISKYGFIISSAIHGIEYFVVTLQIFSKENREFAIRTIATLLGVAVIVRIIIWGFKGYSPGFAPLLLTILSSAGLTFGLIHYYLDRHLFAMREPETREFTGARPLGLSSQVKTDLQSVEKVPELNKVKNGGQRRD